jgi:UrcA family protein
MSHDTTIKSRSISKSGTFAASFFLFATTALGGSVLAAEAPKYDTAIVSYGDLNLESKAGARALYARLRNGAEDVCSSFEGRDRVFKRLWQTCFDQAVAAAVVRVDSPELTSLHKQTVRRSKGYQ